MASPPQMFAHDVQQLGKPLPGREQLDLARRAKAGDDEARRRLIETNLPMVIRLAARFAGKTGSHAGAGPMDELISVGCETLIRSVDRFDPDRGVGFLTYAWSCVALQMKGVGWKRRKRAGICRVDCEITPHLAECLAEQPPPADPYGLERLPGLIATLPERLQFIVRRRLAGDRLDDVARVLGLTRQRVQQLEQQAHAKLRLAAFHEEAA